MSSNDPFITHEDIMDWIFEHSELHNQNPKNNLQRLEKLLNAPDVPGREKAIDDMERSIQQLPGNSQKVMKDEDKYHLKKIFDPVAGLTHNPNGSIEHYHRNAMIHSGETLRFIIDLARGNSGPPPPWVC